MPNSLSSSLNNSFIAGDFDTPPPPSPPVLTRTLGTTGSANELPVAYFIQVNEQGRASNLRHDGHPALEMREISIENNSPGYRAVTAAFNRNFPPAGIIHIALERSLHYL